LGNGNSAAAQLGRTVDRARPGVALSSASAGTVSGPFSVTATFSEPVTGFALCDIAVANGTASNLAGSGATYTFDVTPAADGTVTVSVPANVAADGAGNGNTAATDLVRTSDRSAPSVTMTSTASE